MKLNSREKRLIAVLIVAVIALLTKSLFLDEYQPANETEARFVEWVYDELDKKYEGFIYDTGIKTFRVVDIKAVEEDGKNYDKAKVRKYLFGVLPYGEEVVMREYL